MQVSTTATPARLGCLPADRVKALLAGGTSHKGSIA
eukprot:CAMPEP_0178388708 /NCGR_PEP_ID=MMETSP0689_2-20121128/9734_1 /TAXON_ID=160604 /ORGANISM="Amphidinium massartii, Strain CS-259" /LENGTH=35 /DNA_ID= /DNA_START= /DNA_END= /DNA_ORIENTATION=